MVIDYNPYDEKTYARLRKAIDHNYNKLKSFRNVRKINIDAAKGHYYDTDEADPTIRRDPVNMMDQFVQVLERSFVQSIPKVRVSNRKNPQSAAVFQEVLNRKIVEMDLVNTLRRSVKEAVLGYMGIAYCGIGPSETDPAGESFCDAVSLPEFVIDLAHDEFDQADIVGHRFSRRIIDLIDDPRYDQEMVQQLKGRTSSSSILNDSESKNRFDDEGSIFDWVDLWQIQIKPANLVVIISEETSVSKPLRTEFYDGPDFGPYVFLSFDRVLDEMMPNSRGAMVLDLHSFVNDLYFRIMQKENMAADYYTYEAGSEDDARRMSEARDGDYIHVENNNAVVRRTNPGTNPQALATAIHSMSLFDQSTGNIRKVGGVSSSADTATEARIDSANTSRLIRDMQLQVIQFTKRILQNIAWLEWTHPTRRENIEIKIGENGLAIESPWSPEVRSGDFIEFELEIVPDSMEHRSSRQQLQELMQMIQGVVIPTMQMPSDRPVTINAPALIKKVAELANLPELFEVANFAQDDNFQSQPQPQVSGSSLRIPAEATGGGGGGASPEEQIVQQVLSGAVSAPQEGG